MAQNVEQIALEPTSSPLLSEEEEFDFSFVPHRARVALYDDMKSAPRITEVEPDETTRYIESLTNVVYEQAKLAGGTIPYTVIREVTENFIHAYFREVIVSILDEGNTIRFADQGPGIAEAKKAQLPGFSSAVEPMKRYIRGVGSGLPIVKDYLDSSDGTITIDDNISRGAVVTISKVSVRNDGAAGRAAAQEADVRARYEDYEQAQVNMAIAPLSLRERNMLVLLYKEGPSGVTALAQLGDTPPSSTHVMLKKLEEAGLIETIAGKKRALTPLGHSCAEALAL